MVTRGSDETSQDGRHPTGCAGKKACLCGSACEPPAITLDSPRDAGSVSVIAAVKPVPSIQNSNSYVSLRQLYYLTRTCFGPRCGPQLRLARPGGRAFFCPEKSTQKIKLDASKSAFVSPSAEACRARGITRISSPVGFAPERHRPAMFSEVLLKHFSFALRFCLRPLLLPYVARTWPRSLISSARGSLTLR